MSPFLKQLADQRQALLDSRAHGQAMVIDGQAMVDRANADLAKLEQLETLTKELFPGDENGEVSTPSVALIPGNSKKAQIINAVTRILVDGRRRSTAELLRELQFRGVVVGGKDAHNNLSAYLSTEDRFSSDRSKGGWGISIVD
jgi:hypothetical protein